MVDQNDFETVREIIQQAVCSTCGTHSCTECFERAICSTWEDILLQIISRRQKKLCQYNYLWFEHLHYDEKT